MVHPVPSALCGVICCPKLQQNQNMALTETAGEAAWLKRLFTDIDLRDNDPIHIAIDNKGAIDLVELIP
jgi:hypothetical protein